MSNNDVMTRCLIALNVLVNDVMTKLVCTKCVDRQTVLLWVKLSFYGITSLFEHVSIRSMVWHVWDKKHYDLTRLRSPVRLATHAAMLYNWWKIYVNFRLIPYPFISKLSKNTRTLSHIIKIISYFNVMYLLWHIFIITANSLHAKCCYCWISGHGATVCMVSYVAHRTWDDRLPCLFSMTLFTYQMLSYKVN